MWGWLEVVPNLSRALSFVLGVMEVDQVGSGWYWDVLGEPIRHRSTIFLVRVGLQLCLRGGWSFHG